MARVSQTNRDLILRQFKLAGAELEGYVIDCDATGLPFRDGPQSIRIGIWIGVG
jgi:hypothetical protein